MTWPVLLVAGFIALGLAQRRPRKGLHFGVVALTLLVIGFETLHLHIL
jgi:hypothetical protein